ncbi:WD40-repeat-containing domain protein [Chaetomium strumarium]|uniref:ASTRA-associated protein 1 n=1 Tax=Chaetomium strumarium TaxID=1170767 RepID=A0AAJ0GUT7_9PEZI|nr:WD40-repeat-containing domain protein [Chaetomium strumarium]
MATEARPAQPKSILRGHKAQVHAAAFVRGNERLLTGDADGYVVAWDLTIMRPRAVWQAHANAILGIAGWGQNRLITHGRDNKLIVWKLSAEDESRLSTRLPLDPSPESRAQPWILHMLDVNTMNFCSFSHCPVSPECSATASEIFVAVPNTLASEAIDIFHLPSQTRRHTVKLGEKNGMVMAVSLLHQRDTLTLVAGYENGLATVAKLDSHGNWTVKYQAQCHSQPILSLDVCPGREFFLTSSADAIIAKHPLPTSPPSPSDETSIPPPPPSMTSSPSSKPNPAKSLLSAVLSSPDSSHPEPQQQTAAAKPSQREDIQTQPLKAVNTKHAGQQSLRIRSDGRIFATAGWDAKVRVYSTKTLAEVAVLKWHQVGCYATAFAEVVVVDSDDVASTSEALKEGEWEDGQGVGVQDEGRGGEEEEEGKEKGAGQGNKSLIPVPKLVEMTVREKRVRQVRTAHWLAAGSKDGKVSLWDVF